MKQGTITDLLICDSCLVACDGVPEQADDIAAAQKLAERWPGYMITGCCDPDGDCAGFSWSACEGCGESLGGQRHLAAAISTD